jgi:hypothetical protein
MAFLIRTGFLRGPKKGEFLAPERGRGLVNTPEPCADLSLFKKRMWRRQHQTKGTLKALSICLGACAARSAVRGRWCCPLSFMGFGCFVFLQRTEASLAPSHTVRRPHLLIRIRSLVLGTWELGLGEEL